MKTFKNVLQLAGNSKFCKPEVALGYLDSCYDDSVWIMVLTRTDISPRDVLVYAEKRNRDAVWVAVLSRIDVNLGYAINIATRMCKEDVWVAVIGRTDVDFKTALTYASLVNYWRVWLEAYKKPDIIPEKIISNVFDVADATVWGMVLKNESIVAALDALSLAEVTKMAESGRSSKAWSYIAKRKDCTAKEALECARKSGDSDIYSDCLEKEDVLDFLNQMPQGEIIAFARANLSWKLWQVILARPYIEPKTAILMLKEIGDQDVFETVFEREDVKLYLDKLTPDELIDLTIEADDSYLWMYTNKLPRIINHLSSINIDDVMAILRKLNGRYICLTIVKRDDFPVNDISALLKEIPKLANFSEVLFRKQAFVQYFNSLADDKAAGVAKSFASEYIYRMLVKRKTLTPELVLLYANEIQDQETWDIVLARLDVIKYLGIEKKEEE